MIIKVTTRTGTSVLLNSIQIEHVEAVSGQSSAYSNWTCNIKMTDGVTWYVSDTFDELCKKLNVIDNSKEVEQCLNENQEEVSSMN